MSTQWRCRHRLMNVVFRYAGASHTSEQRVCVCVSVCVCVCAVGVRGGGAQQERRRGKHGEVASCPLLLSLSLSLPLSIFSRSFTTLSMLPDEVESAYASPLKERGRAQEEQRECGCPCFTLSHFLPTHTHTHTHTHSLTHSLTQRSLPLRLFCTPPADLRRFILFVRSARFHSSLLTPPRPCLLPLHRCRQRGSVPSSTFPSTAALRRCGPSACR